MYDQELSLKLLFYRANNRKMKAVCDHEPSSHGLLYKMHSLKSPTGTQDSENGDHLLCGWIIQIKEPSPFKVSCFLLVLKQDFAEQEQLLDKRIVK